MNRSLVIFGWSGSHLSSLTKLSQVWVQEGWKGKRVLPVTFSLLGPFMSSLHPWWAQSLGKVLEKQVIDVHVCSGGSFLFSEFYKQLRHYDIKLNSVFLEHTMPAPDPEFLTSYLFSAPYRKIGLKLVQAFVYSQVGPWEHYQESYKKELIHCLRTTHHMILHKWDDPIVKPAFIKEIISETQVNLVDFSHVDHMKGLRQDPETYRKLLGDFIARGKASPYEARL